MQLLYNSDSFSVLAIELRSASAEPAPGRPGAYEIVDKFSRRGIFLDGALAECFREGVEHLMKSEPSMDELDEYIGSFTSAAQIPLVLH